MGNILAVSFIGIVLRQAGASCGAFRISGAGSLHAIHLFVSLVTSAYYFVTRIIYAWTILWMLSYLCLCDAIALIRAFRVCDRGWLPAVHGYPLARLWVSIPSALFFKALGSAAGPEFLRCLEVRQTDASLWTYLTFRLFRNRYGKDARRAAWYLLDIEAKTGRGVGSIDADYIKWCRSVDDNKALDKAN